MYGKHELPHKPEMIPNANTNTKNTQKTPKNTKKICVSIKIP